jgi:hypothetical protein
MDEKYLRYVRKNRKKIGFSILILVFLMTLGVLVFYNIQSERSLIPSNKTVYVAMDGSGDFNCDGTDDQIEINKALAYIAENPEFTTVYLKGPNTYVISDSIFIGSDTTLQGDSTAVIKLKDNADWPHEKPLITQKSCSGNQNIIISGFEIDGNYYRNSEKKRGDGYYNLIRFSSCENIQVYDMYMHDSHGDGLRIKDSENIQFHDNRIYKLGHEGLYAIGCQNVEAWNNNVRTMTNSALRIWNSNHVKFHDNTIWTEYGPDAGGPGIQIQYIRENKAQPMNDIEVYNNTIYDTYGPGIWLIAYGEPYAKTEAQNVHIYNNAFYGCGTHPTYDWLGGIVTSGFYDTLIENNVFDANFNAAVVYMYPTGLSEDIDFTPKGTDGDYTTIVRNNIMTNTLERKYSPEETGYAVIDYFPETHSFVLENNCLYNNSAGNYKNANSTTDIYADPLFVDQNKHDYHLKSNSPCSDAGFVSSDYPDESEDSGNWINIGKHVSTIYASLSGTNSETTPDSVALEETIVSEVEIYDNRMREVSPSDAYKSSPYIDVGGMDSLRYRDVIGFDLSEYTNPEEISNSILSLYWYYPDGSSRPQDTVIEVYRPASSWNSSYVSWNYKDKDVAWKNAGGDWYDKNGVLQGDTPYATIAIKGSTLPDNRYYELDVTCLIKEYVSGEYENTGFLIKARSENNNYIAFYSNDIGNMDKVPKLQLVTVKSSIYN